MNQQSVEVQWGQSQVTRGNDLSRKGNSRCKGQGVRVSLAFQGKPGDHRQLPARLDHPLLHIPPQQWACGQPWDATWDHHRGNQLINIHLGRCLHSLKPETFVKSFHDLGHTHPHPTIVRSGKQRSPTGLHETQHELCARTLPPVAGTSSRSSGKEELTYPEDRYSFGQSSYWHNSFKIYFLNRFFVVAVVNRFPYMIAWRRFLEQDCRVHSLL